MKKKIIKKILKLRKLTNYSIILCKKALIKNNLNIKKTISYLINKENIKYIDLKKLKHGLVYSKLNNSKTLGHIIELKVKYEDVANNKILLELLKKIIDISLINKCKNINDIYNSNFSKNKNIKDILLDKNIMFKDTIRINKFKKIKSDYIFNYNHYNNKISSLIGFKIKKINKIVKRIIKYISLDIIGNINLYNKSIDYLNKYYKNINIDPLLLKRIKLNINKYLYYLNYIIIYKYHIINI
ncbi:MAG: hypothetical protein NHF92_00945 [Candidatus Shikimatogenerans bostrichidophilus]|nr:MAG: hypothetical protein NHF92_00945 [Candidatus Shikimatogenerans bostrichidophilus]